MSSPALPAARPNDGVKYYLAQSAGGLGAVFLGMNARGAELWAMYALVLIGAASVAAGWLRAFKGAQTPWLGTIGEYAPRLYLLTLTLALSLEPNRALFNSHSSGFRLSDLWLCAGVLGYMSGQYRLEAIVKNLFPLAPANVVPAGTMAARGSELPEATRRSAASVSPYEFGVMLMLLPIWASVAQLISGLLPTSLGNPGIRPVVWRAVTLVWLLGIGALVSAAILDYYRRRRMSADEATLYLQDVVWQETRREMRGIDRWLAWARLGFPQSLVGRFLGLIGLLLLVALIYVLAPFALQLAAWCVEQLSEGG